MIFFFSQNYEFVSRNSDFFLAILFFSELRNTNLQLGAKSPVLRRGGGGILMCSPNCEFISRNYEEKSLNNLVYSLFSGTNVRP